MNKLERQLEEDRALRDAALGLFKAELAHVKGEATPEALGERLAGNIGDKAGAASDKALGFVERNSTALAAAGAALASAIGLWVAREPILSGLSALRGTCEKEADEIDWESESPGEDADHD